MTKGNDCPECFGSAGAPRNGDSCAACEYEESCRWCAEHPDRDVRLGSHVSFDRYDWSEETASAPSVDFDASDASEAPVYSASDLIRLLNFLFGELDEYSCEILGLAISKRARSASEVARCMSVSRQAVHRKLLDACGRNPDLARALTKALIRCRRIAERRRRKLDYRRNPDRSENDDERQGRLNLFQSDEQERKKKT